VTPFEHVTVFDDEHADERYHGLVQDVEEGYTRSVALVIPEGPAWLLPAYELALMTAERAGSMGEEGLSVSVVTPESAPLAALGDGASAAVGELLERERVRVYPNASPAVPAAQRVLVSPDGPALEAGRIVALPRIEGRPLRGVPKVEGGFVPVDDFGRVPGMAEHVFAAGDGTDQPLKHGGLAAQQADVAAAGIAAMAGAAVTPEPLRAVIRAVLHTGKEPLYITARIEDGKVESEVTTESAWPRDEKVQAEELGPFLRSLE
jgi:sulfide:quinone oxidoreductase